MEKQSSARAFPPESESIFRRFFEDCPVGFAVLSPDRAIELANRSLGVMLGYAPGELAGRFLLDLVHPGDKASAERMLARLRAGSSERLDDRRFQKRDGAWLWVSLSA